MKVCILMGSPRENGNTAELLKPITKELRNSNVEVDYITLSDKNITPCRGCYTCQDIEDEYGCLCVDDCQSIMDSIIASDCVILGTPIYTWYCTTPMKALLDRHYGLNKFYGKASGSLWEGKKIGIVATHGYDVEYATSPFVDGIKRFCKHSNLDYIGMYSVRDEENIISFQTEDAIEGARKFAREIVSLLSR